MMWLTRDPLCLNHFGGSLWLSLFSVLFFALLLHSELFTIFPWFLTLSTMSSYCAGDNTFCKSDTAICSLNCLIFLYV